MNISTLPSGLKAFLLRLTVVLSLFTFSFSSLLGQEICDNGIDDDGDGFVDCADPDCGGEMVSAVIISATDDAEEENGIVELIDLNADLDLRAGKYNGTRFQNLGIPAGAFIKNAYIIFTASSNQGGANNMSIYAHASVNSPPFTNTTNNVSGRTPTTASASWTTGSWNTGVKYNTPALTELVQEVINLGASGTTIDELTFIFNPASSGKVSAASFEDPDVADRPQLIVEYSSCDRDQDLVPDFADQDDDNDGIPDYLEGACSATTDNVDFQSLDGSTDPVADINAANLTLQGAPFTMSPIQLSGSATLNDYVIDDLHLNGFFGPRIGVDNSFGFNDHVRFSFNFGAARENLTIRINDIDDEDMLTVNAYLGGSLLTLTSADLTFFGPCVAFNGNNEIRSTCFNTLVTNSISASVDISFPSAVDEIEIILYQQTPGDDGGSITVSSVAEACTTVRDFDGDGIPDYLDADSDNDGIVDLIEAGGTDVDGDGQWDYPVPGDPTSILDSDGDGLTDSIDPTTGGTALPLYNTDSFGRPDFLDIDADDDGIVDNIEGQSTAAYTPPVGLDVDRDGIDDAYDLDFGGTPIVPVNKENADLPDYCDSDTDNDGESDLIEGYDLNNDGVADILPSGLDADGDGLDDAFDLMLGVNAMDPTNGGQTPLTFPISSVDNTDRAWRIAGGSSFPVEWLSFEARWQNEDALLAWATASETNADRFEIERSLDGQAFTQVGSLRAAGNSSVVREYRFRDEHVARVQAPYYYYRLRQIDLDGKYSFSNTIRLNLKGEERIWVDAYPNPVANSLQVDFTVADAGILEFRILNSLGQILHQTVLSAQVGAQSLQLDLSEWSAGVYIIQMSNEQYSGTTRFVKR